MIWYTAYKNMFGAGLRMWLNATATAIALSLIIFTGGLYDGMRAYAKEVMIATELGGGAYWHPEYDPTDPLTIDDAHGPMPPEISEAVSTGHLVPVLVVQGAIYPNGRLVSTLFKGIDPNQTVLNMPTEVLRDYDGEFIPVLMGESMAKSAGLETGDIFVLRWRDELGSYDAADAQLVHVMSTGNFRIDSGQLWLSIIDLDQMMGAQNIATYAVADIGAAMDEAVGDWLPRDIDYLMADMEALIESDQAGAFLVYFLLIMMAALGIFNGQTLAIFRRVREIGTFQALGLTQRQVVALFTLESFMTGLVALALSAIVGGPILLWAAHTGIPLPYEGSDMGVVIAQRMAPVYTWPSVLKATGTILAIIAVVSYLPARRIAKLHPTDALRGRGV